jgi:hypothetical protein
MIAPERIKTPRRKNTALFPKNEKTCLCPRILKVGKRTIASRLVAARGMD